MPKTHRYLQGMLIALAVAVASPACASGSYYRYSTAPQVRGFDNTAYDRGFQFGVNIGATDARDRRTFDYARHGEYRSGMNGYQYGDRGIYRDRFRQGFVAGYNDGFRRFGESNGTQQGYRSPAAASGYRDGFNQGRDDGRHNRRFEPTGARWYRSADRDYDRRYGPREEFQREYRLAFEQGYDRGYRER